MAVLSRNEQASELYVGHSYLTWRCWHVLDRILVVSLLTAWMVCVGVSFAWADDLNAYAHTRADYDRLYFQFRDSQRYEEQIHTLSTMIGLWPEDMEIWRNLSTAYISMGDVDGAYAVQKIMYQGRRLSGEVELLQFVAFTESMGLPYQAARILELEMTTGQIEPTLGNFINIAYLLTLAREDQNVVYVLKHIETYNFLNLETQRRRHILASSPSGESWFGLYENFQNANLAEYMKLAKLFSGANMCGAIGKIVNIPMGQTPEYLAQLYTMLGECYYHQATYNVPKYSCNEANGYAQYLGVLEQALNAFEHVAELQTTSQVTCRAKAQKWRVQIQNEQLNEKNKCDISDSIRQEMCFLDIRQAYRHVIFTPTLDLKDETCRVYLEAFSKYMAE